MSIVFNCPRCGKMLSVPDSQAGGGGTCSGCKAAVQVPSAGSSWDLSPTPAFKAGPTEPFAANSPAPAKRRGKVSWLPFAIGGGTLAALGLLAALLYLGTRPTWEQQNWPRVEGLKAKAEQAA